MYVYIYICSWIIRVASSVETKPPTQSCPSLGSCLFETTFLQTLVLQWNVIVIFQQNVSNGYSYRVRFDRLHFGFGFRSETSSTSPRRPAPSPGGGCRVGWREEERNGRIEEHAANESERCANCHQTSLFAQRLVSIAAADPADRAGSMPERHDPQPLLLRPVQFVFHPKESAEGRRPRSAAGERKRSHQRSRNRRHGQSFPLLRRLPAEEDELGHRYSQVSLAGAKHPAETGPRRQPVPLHAAGIDVDAIWSNSKQNKSAPSPMYIFY